MSDSHYPIVYVRGYAGSQGEVEDTAATPYMGFNLGSTKLRQAWTGELDVHVFESPLVRLMKDHGYVDAYRHGSRIPNPDERIPRRSVWIYRYYDVVSEELGEGDRKEIEYHAEKLRDFIEQVRSSVLTDDDDPTEFRVHLTAHSMGGLVCRTYLQNREIGGLSGLDFGDWRDKGVDKLFTFATPHGGIEFRRGLGWAEGLRDFVDPNNAGNFGPKRMRQFLDLGPNANVQSLADRFPRERVFCMVGTDAKDYGAAMGMSKASVGPLSDGLVQIENATVIGAPRAFTYRSHSGHYGIVNAESSYQNMVRFLFGDVRVDGILEVEELTLPPKVQDAYDDDKSIRASYHFETIVRVRGARWDLHRRLVDEGSAIFREFDEMFHPARLDLENPRHPFLFSTYLSRAAVVNPRRQSLGFSVDLAVQVPEYTIEKRLWWDDHFDGGYLFRDKLNFEITPPKGDDEWRLKVGFDSKTPNRATSVVEATKTKGEGITFEIPIASRASARPGIKATLKLRCRAAE